MDLPSAVRAWLVAQPGQTIRLGGLLSSAGGYASSLDVGSTMTLKRTSADTWVHAYPLFTHEDYQ